MSESAHGHPSSIDYGSYLRLPELLELQTLQSSPEHPDELLFIVVHQASELWFKALRHEMDTMITALEAFDTLQGFLEHVSLVMENAEAARSTLMDLDVAAEMSSFTSNQILQQAGVSMLAQANQMPQNLLRLFR